MSVTLLRMRRHVGVPTVRSMICIYGNEFLRVRINDIAIILAGKHVRSVSAARCDRGEPY